MAAKVQGGNGRKPSGDGVPMKHSVYIDQLTLEFWAGKKVAPANVDIQGSYRTRFLSHKLDVVDAYIVAFIADLNPNDKAIQKIMWRGYFLIKLAWLRARLPLLEIDERALHRRLRWLRMMGILESLNRTVDGNKSLAYYRMSALYWRVRARRHEKAAKAAKSVKAMVHRDHGKAQNHGPQGPRKAEKAMVPGDPSHGPWGPSRHIQDMPYSTAAPPSPAGASSAPPARGPTDQVAKKAFSELRKICGLGPRPPDMPRDKRLSARKRLLDEQAQLLLAPGPPAEGDSTKAERTGGAGEQRQNAGETAAGMDRESDPDRQSDRGIQGPQPDQDVRPGAAAARAAGREGPAHPGGSGRGGRKNARRAAAIDSYAVG